MACGIVKKEIDDQGTIKYLLDGELHRTDGPAVEYADGSRVWYLFGKCHRANGPAVEYENGDREWYLDGFFHRVDGPAIEYPKGLSGEGEPYMAWYVRGKMMPCTSQEEFKRLIKLQSLW